MKQIFFNEFGRIRSGWRFLIFQLSFIFVAGLATQTISLLFASVPINASRGTVLSFIVPNVVLLAFSLLVGWACGKFLEAVPFKALGLWFTRNWLKDLLLGLIVGSLSIILAVLVAMMFGGMRLEANQAAGSSAIFVTLFVSLVVFTIGALAEEAYFRGYILQTFARAGYAWLAIGFTSLFFASAHLNNQNSDWVSTVNTALAGVWLGVAYLKTRNLWFPFGIHLTWNWLQGAILGIPVSGITSLTTAPYLQQTEKGVSLITGGDYGIEGGIACTLALIVSGLLIWFAPFIKPTEEMLALTSEESGIR